MRPFGCPVTILNTIDILGKFDGKADEGFFVGYSLNSKAFRVFNSRTRTVEENLHIRFSKSTPNVVGTKASDNADLKSSHNDGSKPLSDDGNKVDEDPSKESECNDQDKEDNVNSTNNVNTIPSQSKGFISLCCEKDYRYLKGQPKLGIWYPKDSPFNLVAHTNSDYAGASLDRKSTTGGYQFLGCRLISWKCKKLTVVLNFITEAEYVAASS
nr:uncharacterized mitochondrial protein AtMg00810-like [Tanacetum cinerariifolium]